MPLNSHTAFETVQLLAAHFKPRMMIGAGTVTPAGSASHLADLGRELCVAPNTDVDVIRACSWAGTAEHGRG